MATPKQLSFIKAICDELGLDEPRDDIPTWEASSFISKYSAKFYLKKERDEKNKLKSSRSHNHESLFKADINKEITRMSTEQNVKNIKNICRNYFGYDIWAGKKH